MKKEEKAFYDKKKAKVKKNDFLKDNMQYDEIGNVIAVLCWKCGEKIAGWVDDTVTETKVVNGEKHHYIKQKFVRLANYSQAQFELDNGAKYEPVFCSKCAPTVKEEDGERALIRDIEISEKKGHTVSCFLSDIKCKKGVR